MKAIVLTGHGGLDKLEYHEDWPTPEPAPGEVQIKIGACGLNNTDINTRTAWYSKSVTEDINAVGKQGFDEGETAVIAGASGGVGSGAIQLCKLRGAKVIAIASASKFDHLVSLGADFCIDRNSKNLEEQIRECSKEPVDVALDVVSGTSFMPLINTLRQGGRYSSSGAISGPMVEFDLRQLIYKDLQLTGATIVPPGTMPRVVSLIEQGLLKAMLAQSFPL